jgi:hypothetical protein
MVHILYLTSCRVMMDQLWKELSTCQDKYYMCISELVMPLYTVHNTFGWRLLSVTVIIPIVTHPQHCRVLVRLTQLSLLESCLPVTVKYSICIILYEGEAHDKDIIASALAWAVRATLSLTLKQRTMFNVYCLFISSFWHQCMEDTSIISYT